jgi:endonuclease-8
VPEGHTLYRLARSLQRSLGGDIVASASPQGRFHSSADIVDGQTLMSATSWGKHLFVRFDGGAMVHVHLGLYGRFEVKPGPPLPPWGQVRWRLVGPRAYADLRGATVCELLDPGGEEQILARLGPDPLRRNADPEQAWLRMQRSKVSIAALLMDQTVVAGVGNVYRAEVLFRQRLDPMTPGLRVSRETWDAMWIDLQLLLRDGVKRGRIVTTLPEHRSRPAGAISRTDANYVYRRTDLPCRICGTVVKTVEVAARNLYWCPVCQASD